MKIGLEHSRSVLLTAIPSLSSRGRGETELKYRFEDWVRAQQECVAHGNPQPLISWQRRDGAQIQVKIGFKWLMKIGLEQSRRVLPEAIPILSSCGRCKTELKYRLE